MSPKILERIHVLKMLTPGSRLRKQAPSHSWQRNCTSFHSPLLQNIYNFFKTWRISLSMMLQAWHWWSNTLLPLKAKQEAKTQKRKWVPWLLGNSTRWYDGNKFFPLTKRFEHRLAWWAEIGLLARTDSCLKLSSHYIAQFCLPKCTHIDLPFSFDPISVLGLLKAGLLLLCRENLKHNFQFQIFLAQSPESLLLRWNSLSWRKWKQKYSERKDLHQQLLLASLWRDLDCCNLFHLFTFYSVHSIT